MTPRSVGQTTIPVRPQKPAGRLTEAICKIPALRHKLPQIPSARPGALAEFISTLQNLAFSRLPNGRADGDHSPGLSAETGIPVRPQKLRRPADRSHWQDPSAAAQIAPNSVSPAQRFGRFNFVLQDTAFFSTSACRTAGTLVSFLADNYESKDYLL